MYQTVFQVLGIYMVNKRGRVPALKFTFQFGIEGVEQRRRSKSGHDKLKKEKKKKKNEKKTKYIYF